VVGSGFDVNVKEWRLFADLINDVGLTLDMLAPLAGRGAGFTAVAALGTTCKAICGMVAGATRASITSHFALRGNLADVSAKESAQETAGTRHHDSRQRHRAPSPPPCAAPPRAVTLLGLLAGGLLAHRLGDAPLTAWAAFLILTAVHVWANWHGVGCLAFDTINPQRALLLARTWCDAAERPPAAKLPRGRPDHAMLQRLSPQSIARQERVWRPLWMRWFGARIGVGVGELRRGSAGVARLDTQLVEQLDSEQQYLVQRPHDEFPGFRPAVALKAGASGADALRAVLHCESLSGEIRSRKRPPTRLGGVEKEWPAFAQALRTAGWRAAELRLDYLGAATRVAVHAHAD
jgi:hypothetical protein